MVVSAVPSRGPRTSFNVDRMPRPKPSHGVVATLQNTSRGEGWIVGAVGHERPRRQPARHALNGFPAREPSLCVHDVSQHEFREPDDKLPQPCILFKQRHDIVVGVLAVGVIVTSKRRSIEAPLCVMHRMYESHGQSPYSGSQRAPVGIFDLSRRADFGPKFAHAEAPH